MTADRITTFFVIRSRVRGNPSYGASLPVGSAMRGADVARCVVDGREHW